VEIIQDSHIPVRSRPQGGHISCQVCGSSAKVEGDFVAYLYSTRSQQLGSQIQMTKFYRSITPFIYRACMECTRSKLQVRIRIAGIITKILLCPAIIAVILGVWASCVHHPPRWETSAVLGSIALVFVWSVAAFDRHLHRGYLKHLTSDRDQASEGMLSVKRREILEYVPSLKLEFRTNRNYRVVTRCVWKKNIQPKLKPAL